MSCVEALPRGKSASDPDSDPVATKIPGALDRVISAGATVEPRKSVFGSLRVRHFGSRPLIEDGNVNSKSTTIWNGGVGYRLSNKARLVLEAFDIFSANVSDIDAARSLELSTEVRAVSGTFRGVERCQRDSGGRLKSAPPGKLSARGRVPCARERFSV
jgi:hypothetical protein